MCKNTKWWNEQVKTIVKEKKRAWKRLLQTGTRQMLEEYKNKRNEAKRIVAEAKKKSWEEFGKEIEESFHENKNVWTTVKHLRGNMGKKVRSVKDKNGQLQTNTDKIL